MGVKGEGPRFSTGTHLEGEAAATLEHQNTDEQRREDQICVHDPGTDVPVVLTTTAGSRTVPQPSPRMEASTDEINPEISTLKPIERRRLDLAAVFSGLISVTADFPSRLEPAPLRGPRHRGSGSAGQSENDGSLLTRVECYGDAACIMHAPPPKRARLPPPAKLSSA